MKVLLLGKSGMLGSCFMRMLAGREDFEMYAFSHADLDLTDSGKLDSIFQQISPDFVLNCAAFTDVDACETDQELAYEVNSGVPGHLAKACKKENAILLHFSTDYVFDGAAIQGYAEDAATSPLNVYGKSKLSGEEAIIANCDEYYIVRTSWLFGEGGKNFVDTMLSLSKEREEIDVVSDQQGSPTYTNDLAEAVIENFLAPYLDSVDRHHEYLYPDSIEKGRPRLEFGVYHLSNSGVCTWSEFAVAIFSLMDLDTKVRKVSSAAFPRPAVRPKSSVLLNTKLEAMRPWQDALKSYLELYHKR